MTTNHQYLDKYPISTNSEKLIVGTIHPHNHENFTIPFFYGNVTSIWTILSEAFPEELQKPLTLKGIITFLDNKKISVSDVIRKCERTNPTSLDKDLVVTELNNQILDDIRNSKISEILFTSGFGKNNAFKLFYVDILKQKITSEVRQNRGITLGEDIFGRPVKLTILFSPAGTANVGLSTSKTYLEKKDKYEGSTKPVHDFKVDYYRQKFGSK